MEETRILFVFNPRAGKAKIKNKLCDIINIFAKAGYEITVYPTQKEGDAVRAVRDKKEDYDLVVCSGGEYELSVTAIIEKPYVMTSYGKVQSTDDFRKLAIKDF